MRHPIIKDRDSLQEDPRGMDGGKTKPKNEKTSFSKQVEEKPQQQTTACVTK
jgi:hypothetical protein